MPFDVPELEYYCDLQALNVTLLQKIKIILFLP